jgi:RNA polymerase sigma-70 factor (ECF subfamily)
VRTPDERPSDDELVERALEGDNGSWDVLARRHEQSVRAVCARVLGFADPDVEDATQEALLNTWRKLRQLDGQFGPWARKCAKNASIDVIKKRKRRREDPPDDDGIHDKDPDPGDLIPSNFYVQELLTTCTKAELRVVRLHFLEGWTYADVAIHLNIAVDTAEGHGSSAIERWRERYVDNDLELADVRLAFVPHNLHASLTNTLRKKALWVRSMYSSPGGRAVEVLEGFQQGSRTLPPVPDFAADWLGFSVAMLMSHLAFCVLRECPRDSRLPYEEVPLELQDTPTCGQRKVRWNICHVAGLVFDDVDDFTTLARYESLLSGDRSPTRALALQLANQYFEHHLDVTLQPPR